MSVVVPTYRGRDTLPSLVDRVGRVLDERGATYEVVVVDDASPDDTWDVVDKLAHADPHVVGIGLFRNSGQAVATMCGLAHARGAVVVTMDDDLQHPPEEVPTLLDALDEHPDWDAVIGTWGRDDAFTRNLGSRLYAWTDRLAHGTPPGFRHTAFRAVRRSTVDALLEHRTRAPVVGPLLQQVAGNVQNVTVSHAERGAGRSQFRYAEGIRRALTNFTQGSILPLQVLSVFGLFASLFAVLLAIWSIVRWVIGSNTPPGWLSVFLATVFFGGAALLGIGILGQYLQLVLREVRGAPRWSVRRRVGGET